MSVARARLIAALDDTATGIFMGPGWGANIADALLPVVQALVAEGQAEALEAVAGELSSGKASRRHRPYVEFLRARAAAVRATTSGEGQA